MSNIYEALLRAELDRIRSADGSTADPAISAQHPEANLAALQALAAQAEHSSTPAGSFPWDRVAVREWKPDFEHLPALNRISAGAEQFRSLRARMYEYRDFNKLKSILVCSGQPQEGKSFVAANLALSLAQQRSGRVLLIDADLRRYTLDKLLGAPSQVGLAQYLAGNAELFDILQRADVSKLQEGRVSTALSNLSFIAAGSEGDQVVDLGTSSRFKQLMQAVEPVFDWIVVDSSPVNLVSDAVHYAHECDGVLLVVRSGTTKYEMAQRAQAEFKSGSVIGVVLNGSTDAPRASYYGYGAESTDK